MRRERAGPPLPDLVVRRPLRRGTGTNFRPPTGPHASHSDGIRFTVPDLNLHPYRDAASKISLRLDVALLRSGWIPQTAPEHRCRSCEAPAGCFLFGLRTVRWRAAQVAMEDCDTRIVFWDLSLERHPLSAGAGR